MRIMLAVLAGSVALAGAAMAQSPTERPGRYAMSPAEGGGFMRLDTETGAMALCTRKDAQWSCQDIADPTRAQRAEADRLAAENRELREEIKRLEELMLGEGRGSQGRRAERPGQRFELPTEQDVDKAMDYMSRMIRKFRDKLRELEGDSRTTPL